MSLCLTENVLVTIQIGMFCDGWDLHNYAQIVPKHAIPIPKCPNAQIVPTEV